MAWRLLQSFEQCIESRVGNLMGFVKDVDLEAVPRWPTACCFAQFANLVDAAIFSRVNFNHVNSIPGANFRARVAYAARFRHRLIRGPAIQSHRQNTRHRCFPNPAVPAKNVAVRRPSLLNGILERAGNVLLPDYLGEFLRTVLTRQDLIAHGGQLIIREAWPSKIGLYCRLRRISGRDTLFHLDWGCGPGGGPMQLRLSTRIVDGIAVLDCAGRIVFGDESSLLLDTAKKMINENKRIVLNLSGVSYIDSGGLGTLVSLFTTAQKAGGSIKLANLTERVGDLLQVTKLLTVFEVYDSEEKALDSYRAGA